MSRRTSVMEETEEEIRKLSMELGVLDKEIEDLNKGQLISKCLFDVIVSTKKSTKIL